MDKGGSRNQMESGIGLPKAGRAACRRALALDERHKPYRTPSRPLEFVPCLLGQLCRGTLYLSYVVCTKYTDATIQRLCGQGQRWIRFVTTIQAQA